MSHLSVPPGLSLLGALYLALACWAKFSVGPSGPAPEVDVLSGKREHQQIAFAGRDHRQLAVRRDREIAKCQAVQDGKKRRLRYRYLLVLCALRERRDVNPN